MGRLTFRRGGVCASTSRAVLTATVRADCSSPAATLRKPTASSKGSAGGESTGVASLVTTCFGPRTGGAWRSIPRTSHQGVGAWRGAPCAQARHQLPPARGLRDRTGGGAALPGRRPQSPGRDHHLLEHAEARRRRLREGAGRYSAPSRKRPGEQLARFLEDEALRLRTGSLLARARGSHGLAAGAGAGLASRRTRPRAGRLGAVPRGGGGTAEGPRPAGAQVRRGLPRHANHSCRPRRRFERLCADALVDAERRIEARIAERSRPGRLARKATGGCVVPAQMRTGRAVARRRNPLKQK